MFNVEKLDETIEHIEDEIGAQGCTAGMVSALASLIQARALVGDPFKKKFEKGLTMEIPEGTEFEEIAVKDSQKYLWSISEKEGCITITPMNGDEITIHGREELKLLIASLMDCYQR